MNWWRYGLAFATLAVTVIIMEVQVGRALPLRVPLSEVPFRLATWTGRVVPVDPEFMQRARPNEVLNRRYTDETGKAVFLYIGYYERQASRGQVLAVCHGACQLQTTGIEAIEVQDGRITVNRARIRQARTPMMVLYWYQQRNRVTSDPYRGKIEQARRAVLHRRSEGALVRVSAPIVTTEEDAWHRSAAFAKALFPLLRQHFPD